MNTIKQQNKQIFIVVLVAILLIGIGYASLANNVLSVTGDVTATADQNNFNVFFTGEVTKTLTSKNIISVDANPIANSKNATINILGLNNKGDYGYAILEIQNSSNGIDAEISVTASTESTDLFKIDVIMCDKNGNAIKNPSIASGEKTYVKIFAELLKTPVSLEKATITAQLTALPKEANLSNTVN